MIHDFGSGVKGFRFTALKKFRFATDIYVYISTLVLFEHPKYNMFVEVTNYKQSRGF